MSKTMRLNHPKMRVLSSPLFHDTTIDRELQLEEDAKSQGIARYWRNAQQAIDRGEGALLQPAQRLVTYWMPNFVEVIRKEQRAIVAGEAGTSRHIYGPLLVLIDAERLAATALSECLSVLLRNPSGVKQATIAHEIGVAVAADVQAEMIREQSNKYRKEQREAMKAQGDDYRPPANDGDLWNQIIQATKRINPRIVNRVARRNFDHGAVQSYTMSVAGLWLLMEMFAALAVRDEEGNLKPAFVRVKRPISKKKMAFFFDLHDYVRGCIHDAHTVRMMLRPRYQPMVTRPFPWQPGDSGALRDGTQGGYVRIRTPLVSRPIPQQKAAYLDAKMPDLLRCLDRVSAAAWQINPELHKVVRHIWETGGNMLGIPPRDQAEKPIAPDDFDTNPAAKHAHKDRLRQWYDDEIVFKSERTTFCGRLAIADQHFADTIYFPHQLDFRTRAYPIPAQLNHQGPDICRGLLEFSAAVEPGKAGERWLMIHAANCYGVDKVPFEDRADWTLSNLPLIYECVKDPMGTDFWHHADKGEKPWQFLAACFALVNGERGARIPVQMDGTCNGLQHYAALSLDQETASMVNMTRNARPADMYSMVAGKVKAVVEADAEIAKYAHLVTRPLVKQPVMTSTYGVTLIGMRAQIKEYLRTKDLTSDEIYLLSRKFSAIVAEVMRTMCPNAWATMAWLKQVAGAVAKTGASMRWFTPLGFPVVHPYTKPAKAAVKFGAQAHTIHVYNDSAKPKIGRQISTFAPNFIHSMDATHMFMVADACKFDFAAAHDCHTAHAGNTDAMRANILRTMVDLYTPNRLDLLYRYVRATFPTAKVEPPPERGTYNLLDLLDSPYAFN
jgi:DNA-directed RNA polymerase